MAQHRAQAFVHVVALVALALLLERHEVMPVTYLAGSMRPKQETSPAPGMTISCADPTKTNSKAGKSGYA